MVLKFLRSHKLRLAENSIPAQKNVRQSETSIRPKQQQGRNGANRPPEDDDSIPQTKAEARDHIAKIRMEKNLHVIGSNTADLQAALVVLSEELYQKSTHFLLELVQNVDDNSYTVSMPALVITYENRTLRVDCNEVGFSRKNVAAICRIGRSSKSGLDHSRRYIGEKGIGFKSVFKVSDVVWIHSGYYSFKFDKSQPLGMIAPIWTEFPGETVKEVTSILLQLSENYNVAELIEEIKALDPRLLIYLQRIKRIKITINEGSDGPWETTLERRDKPTELDGQQFVTLHNGVTLLSYKIIRLQVRNLPYDPKRAGHTESELLLAFPLSDSGEPRIESQNVFAFLPIRDYGFKFLIQADFLLIASREDIDSSSQWNIALLNRIADALHGAIMEFNNGELRYSWLPYLPFRPYVADFFKGLEETTVELLRKSPILESFAGEWSSPTSLSHVPEPFRDHDGKPLILTQSTKSRYLSHKYPSAEWSNLFKLGVKRLLTEEFIDDVEEFITEHSTEFQNMPGTWHSRLAEALMYALTKGPFWKDNISRMKFVPLRDGRWVAMKDGNLLFPSHSSTLVVPKGIDVFEIHPRAESDYYRKHLFAILGAKKFEAKEICDNIVETHKKRDFQPDKLSISDLISHLVFLYKTGWKNTNKHDIWFVTETGSYCHGSQIYMNSDVPNSAQSIFAQDRAKFPFLHQKYYEAFSTITSLSETRPNAVDWQEWLVEHMNVAQIPRLASPSIGSPFSLSKDFQCILDKYPSTEWLLLIKRHWQYYSKWIVDKGSDKSRVGWKASQQKVREQISLTEVKCHQGVISPLNKTFLPLSSIQLQNFVSVPFLDVPDPNDDEWDYLGHFGVVVELDAGFFIECLRRLKGNRTTRKQISQLYGQIDLWTTQGNADIIKRSFEMHKLVFIPNEKVESEGTWVGIDECVWSGPACLRITPCLESHYPEHQALLRIALRVGDADIKTLVTEAHNILPSDGIDHIAQIFIAINKYLEMSSPSPALLPLVDCKIFPVVTSKVASDFDTLCGAAETDLWFIPDRMYLKDSFEGLVPLLAFGLETIEKIGLCIIALGLEQRLLSKVAKGVSKTQGKTDLHLGYTKSLRKRARYIARLVPKESPNRPKILKQLREIEVYQSEAVIVEWAITSPSGDTFYGHAESGRVASSIGKQGLKVFLTGKDIDVNLPPLELQEELAKFGGIKDPKHFTLLLYLLMQSDLNSIEETFQRRGVPNDLTGFDSEEGKFSYTEEDESKQPEPQKPQPQPKKKLWQTKLRRKPRHDEDASEKLGAFIKKVERIKSLQKKINEPWGTSDIVHLFSKICQLERRDAASLLPQGLKAGEKSSDNIGSLVDLKAGIWKDLLNRQEDSNQATAVTFDSVLLEPAKPVCYIDEEIQYIGELLVSTFLEKGMGEAYIPSVHWTSQLRNKSGHMPYESLHAECSTFTLTDNGDAFTKLLVRLGYHRAASWSNSPIYHIKVVVAKEGLLSTFFLDPSQVKKSQDCSMLGNKLATPAEVFILVSVFNIMTEPGIALFVDPWQMHVDNTLALIAHSPYHASFIDIKSAIFLQGQTELPKLRQSDINVTGMTSMSSNTTAVQDELFQYQPLRNHREIRLLELFPGKDDMPLEGTIHHVSIDSPGQYWAISYVWGAAVKPFHLRTPGGKIPLTLSLYSALQSTREREISTLLWIDAICIDQDMPREKTVQIRLMRTIFYSAEGVIAWLGDEKDNSDRAIETLLQIRMIALKPDIWPEGLPAIPLSWGGKDLPSLSDDVWKDINLFLNRDWFRRSWIIQELILASDVVIVCGRWTLDWDDFYEAVKICREETRSLVCDTEPAFALDFSDPAYALGLARKSRLMFNGSMYGRRHNLLELLDLFAYTKATRECDKLFALLGLAADCSEKAFDPDYESTLEIIVRRYANEFIRRGQAMDLLYRAGTSKSYPFSSWIPFWTREGCPRTISTWRGVGGSFCAGGNGPSRAHVLSANPSTLVVRGIELDIIAYVSDANTENVDIVTFINSIYKSIDSLKSASTGQSRHELKLMLPIGSASRPYSEPANGVDIIAETESKREDWPLDLRDKMTVVSSIQEFMNFLKKPQDAREVVWKYWQTVAAFAKRLSNGTFCVTAKGYAGMVPGDTLVGDKVCIFSGGAVPFILRNDGDKQVTLHKLIGEAYIHGFMYGEALAFKHITKKDFHLS